MADKLLHSMDDARAMLGGKGLTSMYELLAQKILVAVKDGTRTKITDESIRRYVASLPLAEIKPDLGRRVSKRAKEHATA